MDGSAIKESLARALRAAMKVLEELALEGPADRSAQGLERWASGIGRQVVRPLLEARLQARLDESDARPVDARCKKCGGACESQGQRSRRWMSQLGPLKLHRRYLHCEACGEGEARAQSEVGLTDGDWTPELESVVTQLATTVPYAMAVKVLQDIIGVEVSVKAAESAVERRATALHDEQMREAERCAPYDEKGLPVAEQQRPADARPAGSGACYVEIDGVVPMTREEIPRSQLSPTQKRKQTRAKRDKARGGRGRKYRLVGREVKNAVLYRADDCAQQSASRNCLLEKRYVSHLGDPKTFGKLLWTEMLRQGFDASRTLIWLSDGAEWIRKLAEHLPVRPLLILDLFHVKHRIWEVGRLLYGERSAKTTRWSQIQCDRAEAGQARTVIQALRFLAPRAAPTREAVAALAGYLESNLDRMNYPAYRAQGLRVGSGAVESANFHVTGARLKLQGMRWSHDGARHMALLRADLFNGGWDRTSRLRAA